MNSASYDQLEALYWQLRKPEGYFFVAEDAAESVAMGLIGMSRVRTWRSCNSTDTLGTANRSFRSNLCSVHEEQSDIYHRFWRVVLTIALWASSQPTGGPAVRIQAQGRPAGPEKPHRSLWYGTEILFHRTRC